MDRRALLLCLTALFALAVAPAASAFDARGSAEQVYVTGVPAGAPTTLVDARGATVASRPANALGGALFRGVEPGSGYVVRVGGASSGPLTVTGNDPTPADRSYQNQTIPPDGYGYLTTRDGTKLAYSVHPPSDVTQALKVDGPTLPAAAPVPTLVEYSGYAYADPAGPKSGIAAIANLMGFAVVDISMRGTGCSGGAYDFFEPLQSLDGYDIIETVARQPWVKGGKVGMFGISYGGISQLFTAATQPPSLAAIAPLSVIDQTQTTLYPGGVLNTGFAVDWAKERQAQAQTADKPGAQPYAGKRIAGGDATCAANQALHPEAADLLAKIRANDHYVPAVADPLSPLTFVDRIKVPTYMACQWTDEQTGGHCPTLAAAFAGTPRKWFTFTNGTHVDSLAPATYTRMYDFLSLYVARQAPAVNAATVRASAPVVYDAAMGVQGQQLPPDPIQQEPTYESALAAFEKLPSVRVLFDNGAGDQPGYPVPAFERSFASWPVPGTQSRRWFLSARGGLRNRRLRRARAAAFTWNAGARPLTDLKGPTDASDGGVWTAAPKYNWTQDPPGTAASFLSAPLAKPEVVLGSGSATLWVRSSARDVDLQATLSEVRPDGKETFVQSGWLRASDRRLDTAKSRPLDPVLSLRARHAKAMPRGRFVKLTIPFYYQGHAYRAGSRLRLRISAPNGDQPIWSFSETTPKGTAQVAIAAGGRTASRLVLPVVPGIEPSAQLPPCPGLRGEPCRDFQASPNRVVRVRARSARRR